MKISFVHHALLRPVAIALLAVACVLFSSPLAFAIDRTPLSLPAAPAAKKPAPPAALPFSVHDFVAFIEGNFQIEPTESDRDYARFIYTERQRDGRDLEIMRVKIRSLETHLEVAFSFKEFNVMHYVAEFMEAPFFTRAESEQLYGLLYAPIGQSAWTTVGRFRARVTLVGMSEGYETLFEFAAATNFGQR